MAITGDVDLEGTSALTQIPWCAFDVASITGVIKLNNSGIVAALPDGSDKTMLINGATQAEIKSILHRNPSVAAPVNHSEYAEIVKLKNKKLGVSSAPAG